METKIIPFVWRTHADRDAALTQLAATYGEHPQMRIETMRVLRNAPERDPVAAAETIKTWIRKTFRYREEPGEQIVLPGKLLAERTGGDCDDLSLLLAAMVTSINIPARFAYWGRQGEGISHVSVEIKTPRGFVNIDPIVDNPPGWTPAGYVRTPGKIIRNASNGDVGRVYMVRRPTAKRYAFALVLGSLLGAIVGVLK